MANTQHARNVSFYCHGESGSAQLEAELNDSKIPHRPRRPAAARRAQRNRAETRHFLRLAKGLVSIQQHRGNTLGPLGECLLQAMNGSSMQHGRDSSDLGDPHHGDAHDHGDPHDGNTHDHLDDSLYGGHPHDLEAQDIDLSSPRCGYEHSPDTGDQGNVHNHDPNGLDRIGTQHVDKHDHSDSHYGDDSNHSDSYYGDISECRNDQHNLCDSHYGDDSNHGGSHYGDISECRDDEHNHIECDDVEEIVEVHERLQSQAQAAGYMADKDAHKYTEQDLDVSRHKEACVDLRLYRTTLQLLQLKNWNKKLVRSLTDPGAMKKLISSIRTEPGYRLRETPLPEVPGKLMQSINANIIHHFDDAPD